MQREEFVRKKWRGYEEVEYHNANQKNADGELGVIIPCMVVEINFDEEIIKLRPFTNDLYTEKDFWVNINHIELPKKGKMKIA